MRAALLVVVALAGCTPSEPPAQNDCDQADRIFARCGVELPVVRTGTCNGVAKAIARCVVKLGTDCDALASLTGRLDECVAQANDDLPPLEAPPLSALDAGDAVDLGADLTGPHGIDGGADLLPAAADLASPRWVGLDVSGSIATGSTRSFSAALDPGTYEFATTGTGDIDLYVRIGHAPTLSLYDCRPFLNDSNEACTINVPATAIVYVQLRADVVDSTFHLVAKED
jgi:hypothetical protein